MTNPTLSIQISPEREVTPITLAIDNSATLSALATLHPAILTGIGNYPPVASTLCELRPLRQMRPNQRDRTGSVVRGTEGGLPPACGINGVAAAQGDSEGLQRLSFGRVRQNARQPRRQQCLAPPWTSQQQEMVATDSCNF